MSARSRSNADCTGLRKVPTCCVLADLHAVMLLVLMLSFWPMHHARNAGGKLSHHVLTSYIRAFVAIVDAQYTGKQVQG